jgi:abortive infection bacteriophage resistance protein
MLFDKGPLTFQEQIELLKKRGMSFPDEKRAYNILSSISYYRLSAYWYTFYKFPQENHQFKEDTDFELVYNTYKFDRKLRILLFDQIERIEIALRTQLIYNYCHFHGSNWYEKKKLFRKPSYYFKFNELMQNEMDKTSEVFIRHYKRKYTSPENPPAWMTLELASFGQLSILFKNLRSNEARKAVANHFGVHSNVLSSWLETLSYVRNSCAHHSRLWNRKLPKPTLWPELTHGVWLKEIPKKSRLNRIYPALGAIAYLLKRLATHDAFPEKLKSLLNDFPELPLDYMGFPESWKNEELWK